MSNSAIELGRVIRQRRIDLQLTQDELAEGIGISRKTLSLIESGEIGSFKIFMEVCTGLGLDILLDARHTRQAQPIRNQMATALEKTAPHARFRRSVSDD